MLEEHSARLLTHENLLALFPHLFEQHLSQARLVLGGMPVKMEEPVNAGPKPVHIHVQCDLCGKRNIEGSRFKCAVCHDYDLCEACEAKAEHAHPMLKIRHPGMNPVKIITILDEDGPSQMNANLFDIILFN